MVNNNNDLGIPFFSVAVLLYVVLGYPGDNNSMHDSINSCYVHIL